MSYQALVIGAGLSGAVMAERLASQLGWRVLVLEQRDHLAGNCFDELDASGVLIHRYGRTCFTPINRRWPTICRSSPSGTRTSIVCCRALMVNWCRCHSI